MWTRKFWKDATGRAVRTGAQSAITALGGDVFNLWTVDWPTVAGLAGGATVLSVLMSLAATQFGDPESAAFAKAVEPTDEKR